MGAPQTIQAANFSPPRASRVGTTTAREAVAHVGEWTRAVTDQALETLQSLAASFEEQAANYERVIELSRRQRDAAAASPPDLDGVTELQQSKQDLLSAVAELEERLAPLKETWARVREAVSEADKAPLAAAFERLGEAMRAVIDEEHETERVLAGCRDEVQKRLAQLHQRRSAARAYSKIQDETRFHDRKY